MLPEKGHYVVARLLKGKFAHTVCESLEEMAQAIALYDSHGVATYHANAAFREKSVERKKDDGTTWHQVRTQANVRALKAFWFDLDVEAGNERKFQSQEEAVDGLLEFCESTGLPLPIVVSSGGGIHCYWTLTAEIGADAWKATAENLKALCAKLEFKADPACTGDSARVLRPIGTWNRKSATPLPVELVADAEPLVSGTFAADVLRALQQHGLKPAEVIRSRETATEKLNAGFAVQREFPPCSARKVADRCAQLAKVRDTRGCVSEPHWYAAIQLMVNAVEGDELIHEWSNGYEKYSADETNSKIRQIRSQGMGPTLCKTFEGRNLGGCSGCTFYEKISSPAQLGAQPKNEAPSLQVVPAPVGNPLLGESAPRLVARTLPAAPAPFTRSEKGVMMEEDGVTHTVYPYDIYPIDILFDESVGYEVVRIRHYLPKDGWQEFDMRSALIARPTDFDMALRDHHVQPFSKNRMVMYMDSYIARLRQDVETRRLFKSMGWKDEGARFVLGDRIFNSDGTVTGAGSSAKSHSFLAGFRAKGDLESWVALTSIFQHPGMEPHAFMLLTAFAAPLLELGGRDGFTVSALGETGLGKSTMGKLIASVYGHWKDTWIGADSTANARTERIGTYNSIPCYMDEISTIEPKDLRQLIYMIPTGKGRDSLTRTRDTREGTQWRTVLIASTNDPLHSKLQEEKANPEAESMRLFEFEFPKNDLFLSVAPLIHEMVDQHYGLAGSEYVRRLVVERHQIAAHIGPEIERLVKEFGMQGKERFWSQAAALALYGGKLARQWGLIDFDPESVRAWLLSETKRMRGEVESNVVTPEMVIAQYLDEHVGNRLVVTPLNKGMAASHLRPTQGKLLHRYEPDIQTIWVSWEHLKLWLRRRHHNPMLIKAALYDSGTLLNHKDKKVLGAGTDLTSGEKYQTVCWKLKVVDVVEDVLKHPKLKEAA